MCVPFQAVAMPGQGTVDGFGAVPSPARPPATPGAQVVATPSSASFGWCIVAFGADLSVLPTGCHGSNVAHMGARCAARRCGVCCCGR